MTLPAIIPATSFFADDATAGRVDVNCGGSDTLIVEVGITLEALEFNDTPSPICIAPSNTVKAESCETPSNEVPGGPVQGNP